MTENTGILPIFRDGQSRYPCPETTVHRAHVTHLGNLSRNRSGVVLVTDATSGEGMCRGLKSFSVPSLTCFLASFRAGQPPDRLRGVGQTATPHLLPFSSGGRWGMPAGGSDLPGVHQECAPYPINRPYHGKASLGVISGLPRPFQATGCHLRPHVCHMCRKRSEIWPI